MQKFLQQKTPLKVDKFVAPRKSGSNDQQITVSEGPTDLGRRDALKSIARFSAYVAPTTFVLIDSKSAFAQTCSGAQSETVVLQLRLDALLAVTGGTRRERRRRRRQIRRLRRQIRRLDRYLQQNGC